MMTQVSAEPQVRVSSLLKANLQVLEAGARLTPSEAEALYDLGYQQTVQGHHQEALGYFTILVSLKPSEVKYLHALAYVQQALKQFDEAVAVYRLLDLLDPLNPRYTLSMAECLLQQKRTPAACELLEDMTEFCEARDAQDPLLERARMLYRRVLAGDSDASQ